MQLDFESLELECFGSFTKLQSLDFKSLRVGVHYVSGHNRVDNKLGANGAGKSTLFNALAWCLYGTTPNGLHSTDVKPWSGKGTTQVKVIVKVDNKRQTITRTARPNLLTLNGKETNQDAINKLLGLSCEVFEQTLLLGQGRPLFHDLPNRDKMQLLSDVLDLERWERHSKKASDRVSDLQMKLVRMQGEHATAGTRCKDLQIQYDNLRDRVREWEANQAHKLQEAEDKHEKLSAQLEAIITNFARVDLEWDEVGTQLRLISKDLRTFEKELSAAETNLKIAHSKKTTIAREIERVEQQIEELTNDKKCPTCGQKVEQKNVRGHKEELRSIVDELSISIPKLKPLERAIQAAALRVGEFAKQENDYHTRFERIGRDRMLAQTHKMEREAEVKAAYKEVEHWEQTSNPFREQSQDVLKRKKQASERIKELEQSMEVFEARIERSKFWVKGFKDVRLHVLDDVLQELELVTNSMLDEVGLVGWSMQYAVERETKSGTVQRGLVTTITSPNNSEPVKWASWSGGEAQRLRLVGALALSQVLLGRAGVEPNIEILDEPTRHLSSEGVDDLCLFLSNRARDLGRHVFFIDHMALESSLFASTILVTKTKHGSTISVD